MNERKRIYEEYFQKVFLGLKQRFSERYGSNNEDDVSPDMVAIKDAINTLFPCHIDVFELEKEAEKNYQLIKYDISRAKNLSVEFHGKIKTCEVEEYSDLLESVLISHRVESRILRIFDSQDGLRMTFLI